MYIKVFLFTTVFIFGCYQLNVMMLHKLKKRYARREGRLDEFLQQEELEKQKSFTRRWFGKVGGGEEDGIDGGIVHTTLGGDWELKTLNGQRFGSANLSGHYYLMYFGSTLCPDICPLTLHTLMKALSILKNTSEGKQYIKPIPVFVSVNPTYDTPEKLTKWRDELYGPNLIVVRENDANAHNMQDCLKKFKVPVGLNDGEKEKLNEYFITEAEQRQK